MVCTGEWHCEPYAITLVSSIGLPSRFTSFAHGIVRFTLSSLISWL